MGRSQQERATRELTEAVREFTEAVETLRRQNEEAQERLFWLYQRRPALEAESLRQWLSEAAEMREGISEGVVVIPVPVSYSYESGGGLDEESSIELALKATREMRGEVERPPGEPAPDSEEVRRRREERREAESEDRA